MIVAALEHKIASTNAETASIDRGLRAEDHARDAGGASGVGPRGGRYIVIRGKKHYVKK